MDELNATQELTLENYFTFGADFEGTDFVLSNGALSRINPDEGGSEKKLERFLRSDEEKKESKALERGTLLHRFAYNPEDFVVEGENKPSVAVVNIIKDVIASIHEKGLSLGENLHDYQDVLLVSARNIGYGASNWTSATVISKLLEAGAAYFSFLVKAEGKVMTDGKTKEILENVCAAIQSNPMAKAEFLDEAPGVVKEWPILFRHRGVRCKALLDNTVIDLEHKQVTIRDIKTTSHPVGKYYQSRMYDVHLNNYRAIGGSFFTYRTYRQLAFYTLAVLYYLRERGYDPNEFLFFHAILACETVEPYEVEYMLIPPDIIEMGIQEIDYIFDYVIDYQQTH